MDLRREALAALAHAQWSAWWDYAFSMATLNEEGSLTFPVWAVERWQRQAATPYAQLPESEKDSDRAEADKVLALLTFCKREA